MNLMKALVPSAILTLIVSAIAGSAGSRGSLLNLESATFDGHTFYWSWPFFMIVMAINCILIAQMTKDANA